ncbi:conserved protein of unknown function [Cupriavidus neocaledonicus]|uniref:Uncharacterized protein n=1 Tax=Cupriavidus neocaledonicus TaxID=1040979 RepID=A0A375H1T0_9BURK|nr:hypothetical protein CBM2605_A80154 [Cupriavidus neocaledonicus]SPD46244.1 conserved protein of unknown function [Cupriavidus neocaledonicus]
MHPAMPYSPARRCSADSTSRHTALVSPSVHSPCWRLTAPSRFSTRCWSGTTPALARHACTQTSGHPSSARIGRPDRATRATRVSAGTPPPTPLMHDISARPLRSNRTAQALVSCATLEQPEQA